MSPLFGRDPLANPSVRVTRPGLRPALQRGRGDRVPPRNTPFALSTAFPRKASSPRSAPRGGAGSARPQMRPRLHRKTAPLGHRAFICPRWLCYAPACSRPVFADARSASLRENRLSRHPRVCPRRAFSPSLGHLAEGRALHAR